MPDCMSATRRIRHCHCCLIRSAGACPSGQTLHKWTPYCVTKRHHGICVKFARYVTFPRCRANRAACCSNAFAARRGQSLRASCRIAKTKQKKQKNELICTCNIRNHPGGLKIYRYTGRNKLCTRGVTSCALLRSKCEVCVRACGAAKDDARLRALIIHVRTHGTG